MGSLKKERKMEKGRKHRNFSRSLEFLLEVKETNRKKVESWGELNYWIGRELLILKPYFLINLKFENLLFNWHFE